MFEDRADAGRQLAEHLGDVGPDPVVLGLPRGGVPVAFEVAAALGAPLDVIMVRKLGVPWQPELAMGALGEDGVSLVNEVVVRSAGVGAEEWGAVERRQRAELERSAALLRAGRPRVPLEGRTAVVVDDGIATGSTAKVACQIARAHGAARVVLAVPVLPDVVLPELRREADDVVFLLAPEQLLAVGQWYLDFTPTTDREVEALLDSAAAMVRSDGPRTAREDEVEIEVGERVRVPGLLSVPEGCGAVVVFSHGSGSSRHSPRNHQVAETLQRNRLATLLLDLLSAEEEGHRANVFDVELLAGRLLSAGDWLGSQPALTDLPLGYFGASTGAAAALWAASEPRSGVGAVVSRGGRPDLAGPRLASVRAPTLLIVGGRDAEVLDLNRRAQEHLGGESQLSVVPGATHLFEEPGALESVATLASGWFLRHLRPPGAEA